MTTVSPTIHQEKGYRFFFFSREETRRHVHVETPDGEAKFWLEPEIELAMNEGIRSKHLQEIQEIITKKHNEFNAAWDKHFGH